MDRIDCVLKSCVEVTSFASRKRHFRAFINRKKKNERKRVSRHKRIYAPLVPWQLTIEFRLSLPFAAKDFAKMHSRADRINLLSDNMLKVLRVYVS